MSASRSRSRSPLPREETKAPSIHCLEEWYLEHMHDHVSVVFRHDDPNPECDYDDFLKGILNSLGEACKGAPQDDPLCARVRKMLYTDESMMKTSNPAEAAHWIIHNTVELIQKKWPRLPEVTQPRAVEWWLRHVGDIMDLYAADENDLISNGWADMLFYLRADAEVTLGRSRFAGILKDWPLRRPTPKELLDSRSLSRRMTHKGYRGAVMYFLEAIHDRYPGLRTHYE